MSALDAGLLAESPTHTAEEEPEESLWLRRARAGEEAAFRWLLDRYRMRAVRLAAHILRRPEEAEDVAQEAFVRAFRGLKSFREEGRFYTWLYRIVLRLCLDRQRSARWKAEVLVAEPESQREEEAVDTRLLVESLLDRLSPELRAALALRELDGLEYEEIARILEIPVGTVRSRLSTARARFWEMYCRAMQETENV